MNAAGDKFLTMTDVGQRLQCSRTTVWRLVNERGLRVIRSGGLVRVRESDLDGWLAKHSTGGETVKQQ